MKVKVLALALIPLATVVLVKAGTVGLRAEDKSVLDGIYTSEQAGRGKQLYSDACASCHGAELTGGEMAPPLVGGEFTSEWNGLAVGDLFDRIRISMPQNAPGSLTGQQCADILAFVLQVNKFPTGTTELAKDAAMFKEIRFETKKPVR